MRVAASRHPFLLMDHPFLICQLNIVVRVRQRAQGETRCNLRRVTTHYWSSSTNFVGERRTPCRCLPTGRHILAVCMSNTTSPTCCKRLIDMHCALGGTSVAAMRRLTSRRRCSKTTLACASRRAEARSRVWRQTRHRAKSPGRNKAEGNQIVFKCRTAA